MVLHLFQHPLHALEALVDRLDSSIPRLITERSTPNKRESTVNEEIGWPQKTGELHSHHFDSTIWNELEFRDDAESR